MKLSVGVRLILEIILSKSIVLLSSNDSLCIESVFQNFGHSPTLVAVSPKREPLALSLSQWFEDVNKTFILIDENYSQKFSHTHLRVDSMIIVLECQQEDDQLLKAIKKNRLIHVTAKVVVFADVQCDNNSQEEVSMKFLKNVRRILNPSFAGVVTFSNSRPSISWYLQNGTFSYKKGPFCNIDMVDSKIPKGYELKVAAVAHPPYVEDSNPDGQFEEGLEVRIILLLAEIMGMKVIWVKLPSTESPLLLLNKNGSYGGFIGMLDRLEADVAFGGVISLHIRSDVVEMLHSHTEDYMSWAIAAPPSGQNWGAITSVYSGAIWILLLCVFISITATLACVTLNSSRFPDTLSNILIITWAVHVNQSISQRPKRFLYSVLIAFYLIYCVIITNAYCSSLVRALTKEAKANWYETPKQVVDAGEIVGIVESGLPVYLENSKDDPMWAKILEPGRHFFIDTIYASAKKIIDTRRGMMMCPLNMCTSALREIMTGRNMKPRLIFLKKRHNRYPVTIYAAPGFPLYPAFNLRVMWLLESGLVDHWLKDINHCAQLRTVKQQRATKQPMPEEKEGPRKLTMRHLQPVFFLLLATVPFAIGLFLAEIIFFKSKNYF